MNTNPSTTRTVSDAKKMVESVITDQQGVEALATGFRNVGDSFWVKTAERIDKMIEDKEQVRNAVSEDAFNTLLVDLSKKMDASTMGVFYAAYPLRFYTEVDFWKSQRENMGE